MSRYGIKRTSADVVFSRSIRERDDWTCQRCKKQHLERSKGLHAAHGFTRRTKATRFDPSNAIALCWGCHQFVDSHAAEKEALWRWKFGDEEYERVSALAHEKRDRTTA